MNWEIVTRIGGGKVDHAARYFPMTNRIEVDCGSLKYNPYHALITDLTPPDESNVTCKKCRKLLNFK